MENILTKASQEISGDDTLYRRVSPVHFDENENVSWAAFELQPNLNWADTSLKVVPESYVSVNLASKLSRPEKALGAKKWVDAGYKLVGIKASDIRTIGFEVIHAPTGDKSHSAICGYFTSKKYSDLALKAVKI